MYFSEYKCFITHKEKLFEPELMFECEVKRWSYFPLMPWNTEKANVTNFHEQQKGSGSVLFCCLNNPILFSLISIQQYCGVSIYLPCHTINLFLGSDPLLLYTSGHYFLCTMQMEKLLPNCDDWDSTIFQG